ncbi:MAG: c-type cytochrome domain-containing protein [Planctomycetota bacterium]
MRGMWYASLAWLASAGLSLADPGLKAPVDYARDIEPVLKARCFECHGPARQRGGYRLDVRASATGSGDSGAKGIVPGKSAESQVMARVLGSSGKRMPPKGDPLSAGEAKLLARWIDAGAPYGADTSAAVASDHWAFRKPARPAVPAAADPWVKSPVDAFILRRLLQAGLKAPVDYARDIEPLLKARCFECHGPARQRGGYRLDIRAGATGSGDSGA